MIVLFLFLPFVLANKQYPQAPGMYPPEEQKNDVPTMPRNPYQMNMVEDMGMIENYQFYYEKNPNDPPRPIGYPAGKSDITTSDVSSGPTPPSGANDVSKMPMYLNESPRSPGPNGERDSSNINHAFIDGPRINRPSHSGDSGYPSQPDSFYEKGSGKRPAPPNGGFDDMYEYAKVGSKEPYRTSSLSKSIKPPAIPGPPRDRNMSPPPLQSDPEIRSPAIPGPTSDNNEVVDPYFTEEQSMDKNSLARSKPSSSDDNNYTGNAGGGSGAHHIWTSDEMKEAMGMDEFPLKEQDINERHQNGDRDIGEQYHSVVGRTTENGNGGAPASEPRSQKSGAEKLASGNAVAGGKSSGTASIAEDPNIVNSKKGNQWPQEKFWKKSTEFESILKNKGLEDNKILKRGSKCCPCCHDEPTAGKRVPVRSEAYSHSGDRVKGLSNAFEQQQEQVTPSFLTNPFEEDLEKLSSLGDMLESSSFQGPRSGGLHSKLDAPREVYLPRVTDTDLPTSSRIADSVNGISLENRDHVYSETHKPATFPSRSSVSTISLQRSAAPLLTPSSAAGGQYVSPISFPSSASFQPAQPFFPAPQSYSTAAGYPSPGVGCPCAPPLPTPCCAPIQPCCMPTIPCCPPPPQIQCCPQPPVCCQPPPPCCPPPPVCCPVPVIPTCFRACPACPCRRRLHAALRMKRSPGLHGGQCHRCTAAGQPRYTRRVKRQSNCKACSNSNPLLSLFAPVSTPSSCSSCRRSDSRTVRVKRMGCLPCGKRKKRNVEEEYHRRVKRLGCLPCLGRKKRSPIEGTCKKCSNLGQVLHRFKRTIVCSPCGRKKREAKKNEKSNSASCPCLKSYARTFLLRRNKRETDNEYDSMNKCDKSCCDYNRCHEIRARNRHSLRQHAGRSLRME